MNVRIVTLTLTTLLFLLMCNSRAADTAKTQTQLEQPEKPQAKKPLPIVLEQLLDPGKGITLGDGFVVFPAKEAKNPVFVNVSFDARDYNTLHVRLRTDKDTSARLNWISDTAPDFKINHGVSFDIKAGAEFQDYLVDLPQNDGLWSGKISSLQFNTYWTTPANVEVQLFTFEHTEDAPQTRFTATTGEHKTMPASPDMPHEWSFQVPGNARFFTGIAFSQLAWKVYKSNGAKVNVKLVDDSEKTIVLYEELLNPIENEKHRHWQNVYVDLAPYAGKNIKITFEQDGLGDSTGDIVFWKDPLVYTVAENFKNVPVILISLDTVRADHLSVYGYPKETTPWLNKWVQTDAVVFENANTQDAWTLPAHTSMLTGLYPKNHGVTEDNNLAEKTVTLAERLHEESYLGIGLTSVLWWLEAKHGFAHGFDTYTNPLPYQDAFKTVDSVIAQLDAFKTDRFFLFTHIYDAHGKSNTLGYKLPYQSEKPEYSKFATQISPVPDLKRENLKNIEASNFLVSANHGKLTITPEEESYLKALYDDCLLSIDKALENFVAELKKRNMYDNALIFITADHGESFHENGMWLHEQCNQNCSHIPMLVKFPKQKHGGERYKSRVELVDIYPTVLEVLKLSLPENLDGQSLLAQLENKVKPAEFSYTQRHDVNAVYFQNWKLMHDTKSGAFAFYDLDKDPTEQSNLYDEANPIVQKMTKELLSFYKNSGGEKPQGDGKTKAGNLSPAEIKELEALGYFQ